MMEAIALQQQANTSDMAKTLPSHTPHPPHRYGVWTLTLLCLGMLYWEIVVWGIAPLNPDFFYSTAFIVFLGVVTTILALDWRHFLSLHGNVAWATLSGPGRIGVTIGLTVVYAVFMVLLFSLPLLYLAFAVKDTIAEHRASAPAHKLKIAELEASLDMLPGTDGECSHCHRSLQAGATFCAYCGMAVARKPRVCARCATVAMPDAQFCPTCGAPFSSSTSTAGA
jgi:RNA polymerase subunit RPABC4/transcription elongation factor Spt4